MQIKVNGIVQGVGFRPFVHKLVKKYGLCGWVKNTSSGVIMELTGEQEVLEGFVLDISLKCPKLAVINSIETIILEASNSFKDFQIIKSTNDEGENFTLISPDVCICDDCLEELFDSNNKRFRFPFINCTNCGPRFTIIKDIPYDRDKTTMDKFKMCSSCYKEYSDIENRRYHAQPDCCYKCGPELFFTDNIGNKLIGDPVELSRNHILDGKIIAIKGLGGFHLACNAYDPAAIRRLREKKRRDEKPFAIMCRDIETVKRWCEVTEEEESLLRSFRRPIVLLEKKAMALSEISPDNNYIGVMLPYTPVHYLLFEKDIDTVIMTSGNISETPILYRNNEALNELTDVADGFLLNNRDIHIRCDDSLMRIFEGREYPLRRSRGYVPFPIKIESKLDNILACGAEQKASFALSKNEYVFLSQHIGDLKNVETYNNYVEQIIHFENMFSIKPSKIVCDMHPDYMSTEYARNRGKNSKIPIYYVQHHHAHMASCMADNNLNTRVIGIIWDGTGYGENGEIWGGEFLLGDYSGFKRIGSIRPILLPGGDKAVKEIYRISYSLLYDTFGHIPEEFRKDQAAFVIEMMLKEGINCHSSSSIGRLFDGISAILGIKLVSSYEGQGAVALEGLSLPCEEKYKYEAYSKDGLKVFDWRPMVRQILNDVKTGISNGIISAKFINTLAFMAVNMISDSNTRDDINEVVLSGGVFQNMYLLKRIKKELENGGFKVYVHSRVSTNDEGIALGQILIAQNGGSVKCV